MYDEGFCGPVLHNMTFIWYFSVQSTTILQHVFVKVVCFQSKDEITSSPENKCQNIQKKEEIFAADVNEVADDIILLQRILFRYTRLKSLVFLRILRRLNTVFNASVAGFHRLINPTNGQIVQKPGARRCVMKNRCSRAERVRQNERSTHRNAFSFQFYRYRLPV